MSVSAVQWIILMASGLASLAAAGFYRALRAASPARLEELNEEFHLYEEMPDLDDALIAMGWLKEAVFAAFVSAIGLIFFANHGVIVAAFLLAAAVSAGALLLIEAIALMAAGYHTGRVLYRLLPAVDALNTAAKVILAPGRALWAVIARVSGREAPPPPEEEAASDILDAVIGGEREGIIRDQEREMIESIVEFRDLEVAEIMTPRTEVQTLDAGLTLKEALDEAIGGAHSRLPVYADMPDNVVGVLHVKDILPYINSDKVAVTRVRDIMRPAYFVPETKRISELLEEFRTTKVHMAVVLDEYGGTSGIATIEDILEEIVGEIEDEYDTVEPPVVRVTAHGKATVEGQASVYEVNEALNLKLSEEEEYETIAGFVLFHIGRIPRPGEQFEIEGIRFRVLDADDRKIKRMALEVMASLAAASKGKREVAEPHENRKGRARG